MASEKLTADFTLHMIGHGHIDPVWLWRWTEGYSEVRTTFASALQRMQETSEFVFTASSACFYQWVKESDPALFEQIRERVAEGRWEIAGGFWVEPDCNIPCGESFVRHGLYSQRFFQREFGKRVKVGFNPDSFGHAGNLPQILKKLGMDCYCYMRPQPEMGEKDYPDGTLFLWQSKDGSSVVTAQLPFCYTGQVEDIKKRAALLPASPRLHPQQKHALCFYGVGDHGGGPTREAVQFIHDWEKETLLPGVHLQFSSLEDFFNAVKSEIPESAMPVLQEELQHHARGCYSVHSEIKRLNRKVEHALMTAERFATAAWLLGALDYPQDAFEKCWKDLLFNQFHDLLGGTSLQSAYEDARDQLGAARHRADVILNQSVQSIARDVDTSAEGNPFLAINPLPWPVWAAITLPPAVRTNLTDEFHVVNEFDDAVPIQAVRGERIGHTNHRFVAHLPALGYQVFHARSGAKKYKHTLPLESGNDFLENYWWRIEFCERTGEIKRLFDKLHRIEVLERGGILSALVDSGDTWGHSIDAFRIEAGRFGQAELKIVEAGDVFVTMRCRAFYDCSEAITEYTLCRTTDHITVNMRVNWQQKHQALKFGFITNVQEGRAVWEAPYGYQERQADGMEEPGGQWMDLTGTCEGRTYGFALLNDCKYGSDILKNTMRITLLRSPLYAHHDPERSQPEELWQQMDQGWHTMRFALMPHTENWRDARIVKRAWELNAPAFVHMEARHPGKFKKQAGLLGTESDHVLLTVIKCSEDGEEVVIRGFETAGKAAQTRLHLPYFDKAFCLSFEPHEIKTIRINKDNWTYQQVNLLEEKTDS
ncbi:MAG: Mannosylglycerate hydrolase [Candidatus Hydrogenedentes bacterium ADurb.Bin170]|nr:MAG: Mannosylglycerate hydrolase [Candidatus Hydrogenedentes bacterium ADurb.Bin170]